MMSPTTAMPNSRSQERPPGRRHQNQVTFSDYSELCIYKNAGSSKKSYSKADRKQAQVQAAAEANRIRTLVSLFQMPTGNAIRKLMELGLLSHEELVGIEHLLSEEATLKVMSQRASHVKLVLRAQGLMLKKNRDGVNVEMLAKVASMSSTKCEQKAQIRADLSLRAVESGSGKLIHVPNAVTLSTDGKAARRFANAA